MSFVRIGDLILLFCQIAHTDSNLTKYGPICLRFNPTFCYNWSSFCQNSLSVVCLTKKKLECFVKYIIKSKGWQKRTLFVDDGADREYTKSAEYKV